jgi:hypothetical protein
MKITVITRDDGEIVGTVRSTSSTVKSQDKGQIQAEVVPLPGQVMLELDVPDDIMRIENPDELHRRVKDYRSSENELEIPGWLP